MAFVSSEVGALATNLKLLERRLLLRRNVAGVIRKNLIGVAYQPILRLADHRLVGFEALMRWSDPKLGPIPPEEFIELAERQGLLWLATRRLFEAATAGMIAFRELHSGAPLPYLSINVSAQMLDSGDFAQCFEELLAESGMPAEALLLEVTETVYLKDYAAARSAMRRLKTKGVRFALDDFGSGYASISVLRALPFDMAKIDRSLIEYGLRSARNVRYLRSFAKYFQRAHLDAVVEGIEQEQHAEFLCDLGFDYGQGFLFGRPHVFPVMPALH